MSSEKMELYLQAKIAIQEICKEFGIELIDESK